MTAPAPLRGDAVLSPCGIYRYRLTREWGIEPLLPFVMLNPSTADASVDDPTIRRCMGFARREGAGGIVVGNLYGLRSPSPDRLWTAGDAIGPENERHLDAIVQEAVVGGVPIVCAWGAHGRRGHFWIARAQSLDARLTCLGATKDGHPRHPLYVRGDQPLLPYGARP